MKIEQHVFDLESGWGKKSEAVASFRPQLVLAFGGRFLLQDRRTFEAVRDRYPDARIILASTAGEISGDTITEDRLSVTAVALERGRIATAAVSVKNQWESYAAGKELAARLSGEGLTHIFVVSDGQLVNGTELSRGFNESLRPEVKLTGGLAGDGARFERTLVGLSEPAMGGRVAAVGFYGSHMATGFGCSGGWTPEGTEYKVTASDGNILFTLDREPALDLYMRYTGVDAVNQPAACLRFPLWVLPPGRESAVVRTILAVEGSTRSMVFAGDVPTGSRIRFMHASPSDLIAGAERAALQAELSAPAELALCVSCVGRRIVLGEAAEQEILAMRRVLGAETIISGFYSYGELAPDGNELGCQLHNQTMTVATFRET